MAGWLPARCRHGSRRRPIGPIPRKPSLRQVEERREPRPPRSHSACVDCCEGSSELLSRDLLVPSLARQGSEGNEIGARTSKSAGVYQMEEVRHPSADVAPRRAKRSGRAMPRHRSSPRLGSCDRRSTRSAAASSALSAASSWRIARVLGARRPPNARH